MNHTTQEPKAMYLAVELEYRREYEAAHELRAQQARIADLEAQLYAIGAGGVGQSIKPPVQLDTAPAAWAILSDDGTAIRLWSKDKATAQEAADKHGRPLVPLYTAPQPASQPLTEARVHDLLVAVCSDGSAPSLQEVKEQAPDIFEFARAIEEAHGITGGPAMTRDDIIKFARNADVLDFRDSDSDPHVAQMVEFLKRFAELVATAERRKHQADIERWKTEAATAEKWRGLALSKEGDGRTVQRIQQEAAALEREACLRIADDCAEADMHASMAANAIRARGQQ